MPLVKGKAASTRKGFSENVRREMHEGKKQSQSVAIAYSEARRGKKDNKMAKKHHHEMTCKAAKPAKGMHHEKHNEEKKEMHKKPKHHKGK